MRRYEYARCAAVLDENHEVPGAAALFDQALTNGLIEIVATEWPGSESERNGHMKSARGLLGIIEDKAAMSAPGIYSINRPDGFGPVSVDSSCLKAALYVSQPVRHGRVVASSGTLDRKHIAALLALDDHPALMVLSGEYSDQHWRKAQVLDLQLQDHAFRYLALIGDEEAERRVNTVDEYLPFDPGGEGEAEAQTCPVCNYETLVASSFDNYGYRVGVGQCIVCSYEKSSDVAENEALSLEWERWQKD